MKRTQVFISDDLFEKIRQVADQQQRSVESIIREALVEYVVEKHPPQLADESPTPERPIEEDLFTPDELEELKKNSLYQIIGLVKAGEVNPPIPDAAENHDYYIYLEGRSRKSLSTAWPGSLASTKMIGTTLLPESTIARSLREETAF